MHTRKKKITSPDHYSLVLKFKNLPVKKNPTTGYKSLRWNTNKNDDWDNYKKITEKIHYWKKLLRKYLMI